MHTKAEKDAINRAFDEIAHHLDCTDMRMPYDWCEALKSEKRQCSGIMFAKGLMVRNFTQGVRNPLGAADLYAIRDGLRMAHMIGAALVERAERHDATALRWLRNDLMCICDLATAAHAANFEREMNELRDGE